MNLESMAISGSDLLEVPTYHILKPMYIREYPIISPQNMAKKCQKYGRVPQF